MNPQARMSRHGFTLIEMLIVITIMLLLTLAAVVMLMPALENRKVREATRMVNGYLGSARSRAMETGRPCGVVFHCFNTTTPFALTMDQCEVPEAYAGDLVTCTATVSAWSSGTGTISFYTDSAGTATDTLPSSMFRIDDLIQLNNKGPMYRITGAASGTVDSNGYFASATSVTVTLEDSTQTVPWATITLPSSAMPYCIYRFPVINSVATLQLPTGAVVDFTASGAGLNGLFNTTSDITVMFAPNGSVDCYYLGTTKSLVVDPIFFLVGKRERMLNVGGTFISSPTTAQQDQIVNVQDLSNFWIVINPLTGLITSDVVASSSGQSTLALAIQAARALAKDSQGMGGK